jgi:tripeptide aminopeptidase
MSVVDRFLKYVTFDTQSSYESADYPSTGGQKAFGGYLVAELASLGVADAAMDGFGYVTGTIPGNVAGVPVLGLLAHMDTSPSAEGGGIKPRIVSGYDGGIILLNEEKHIVMSPERFTDLSRYVGQELIVTDGTTLLGADDKAGVAEIVTMAEILLAHPDILHGDVRIAFTPDEEVGNGTVHFDTEKFGADFAYTVDGGAPGEISYENFNAASVLVSVHGQSVHPGDAKGKMLNASLVALEFHSMLPAWEAPGHTEGYEGFFHLTDMAGEVGRAEMKYIIRDHDLQAFEGRKKRILAVRDYINGVYGADTVEIRIADSYSNMATKIQPHMFLIENAERAMRETGMIPFVKPTRGGTDGAVLSWQGLPCPNLCTGGHYFHGPYEFISVKALEDVTRMLVRLVQLTAM